MYSVIYDDQKVILPDLETAKVAATTASQEFQKAEIKLPDGRIRIYIEGKELCTK